MYTIAKRFSFSAAHRLLGLPLGHKCARLHGHNWEVEVISEVPGLDARGFASLDYGDMTPFKAWLDSEWDHRTLLRDDDPLSGSIGGNHVVSLPCNPTAENLARLLLAKAKELIGPTVSAVRVGETPNTWAEFC